MAIVNAKTFCKNTGFPVAMMRAYCREGKISHWKRGKVYWLDESDAIAELKRMKNIKSYNKGSINKRMHNKRCQVITNVLDC